MCGESLLMPHPHFSVPFALFFFFSSFASLFGVARSATLEVAKFPSAPLGSVAFLSRADLSKHVLGLLLITHSQHPASSLYAGTGAGSNPGQRLPLWAPGGSLSLRLSGGVS